MTQNELNRMVATATGETIAEIRSRGFSPLDLHAARPEPISHHRGRRRRCRRRRRRTCSHPSSPEAECPLVTN